MTNSASKAGELLDTVALLFAERPLVAQHGDDGPTMSGATIEATGRLLDRALREDPGPLTSRQFHMLLTLAAAEFLTEDELAALANGYVDPGVEIWYHPVALDALRGALRGELADNSSLAPLDVIRALDRHNQEELIRHAPADTPFDGAFLACHARSRLEAVRGPVAANAHTRSGTLAFLADDTSTYVARAVARHPRTLEGTLVKLAHEANDWVRTSVASNPNTPSPILHELAESPNANIRAAVVLNTSVSAATRAMLDDDLHPLVIDARLFYSLRQQRPTPQLPENPLAPRVAKKTTFAASHHADLRHRYRAALSDGDPHERVISAPAIVKLTTHHLELHDSLHAHDSQSAVLDGSS